MDGNHLSAPHKSYFVFPFFRLVLLITQRFLSIFELPNPLLSFVNLGTF